MSSGPMMAIRGLSSLSGLLRASEGHDRARLLRAARGVDRAQAQRRGHAELGGQVGRV
jgi:hypothetical protein